MKNKLIIIFMFFLSCVEEQEMNIQAADETVYKYVDSFKHEALKRGLDVPIHNLKGIYIKDMNNAAGKTSKDGFIYIDSATWRDSNECERENIIYHELGHLVLSIWQHSNDGIMRSFVAGSDYCLNKDEYLDLLFNAYKFRQ